MDKKCVILSFGYDYEYDDTISRLYRVWNGVHIANIILLDNGRGDIFIGCKNVR